MSKGNKLRTRYSKLTAADVRREIQKRISKGATISQLGRLIGVSQSSMDNYVSGRYDGKLPVAIDLVFELDQYVTGLWVRQVDDERLVKLRGPSNPANKVRKRLNARAAQAESADAVV
jgi:DNA-binding XRE family transcriptional regulator